MSDRRTLLEEILSGGNRQLQELAAAGLVPLPPEQLIPLQVALADGADAAIGERAQQSLRNLEARLVIGFLEQQAAEPELAWFGKHAEQPEIVEAVLRRTDVPRHLLVALAPRLWPELQEVLLLRQDAILDEPSILDALERNARLTSYAKRRIWEYREHLLPRERVPAKSAEELQAAADSWTQDEVQEAIEEVRKKQRAGEGIDEVQGLTEGQVRLLALPIRIRLARNAGPQLRRILVRDSNAQVALTVIRQSQVTDQEIELIANSRAVHDDVLAEIPKRREWIRKYNVVKALVRNPRLPLPTALRLMSRLSFNDMRALARDRNVPQAVRSQALRVSQTKR